MRESGFYWVQFNVGDWRVAYWTDYAWQVGAADGYWDDEDLIEIDERQVKRNLTCEPEPELNIAQEHPTFNKQRDAQYEAFKSQLDDLRAAIDRITRGAE